MGRLKIIFILKEEVVDENSSHVEKIGLLQHVKSKYNISKMNKLEFDGNDFIIKIKIDDYSDNIDWTIFEYPNKKVKEQVMEIIYYRSISNDLEIMKKEINYCKLDDGYNLKLISKNAISKIETVKTPKYFKDLMVDKYNCVKTLEYIIKHGELNRFLNNRNENNFKVAKRELCTWMTSFQVSINISN